MRKIIKILWVILIIGVIVWGIFIWNNYTNDYRNGIRIKLNNYNLLFSIKKLETNVKIDGKEFTKIMIKLKNYSSKENDLFAIGYELLDENDNSLSVCADGTQDKYIYDDILSGKITGKSTNEGYLYCLSMISNFDRLKISVLSGNKKLEDGTYEFDFDDYYINLK